MDAIEAIKPVLFSNALNRGQIIFGKGMCPHLSNVVGMLKSKATVSFLYLYVSMFMNVVAMARYRSLMDFECLRAPSVLDLNAAYLHLSSSKLKLPVGS